MGVNVRETLPPLLKMRGMTQDDLAAATGIRRTDINALARGRINAGPKRLRLIADALRVSLLDLGAGEEADRSGELLASRDRLRSLEAEVARLIESQREAQMAHDLLLERVEALERRLRPGQIGARPVELATREGSVRRGMTP